MAKPVHILRYVSDLHLELRKTIYHPKLLPLWDFQPSSKDKYYLALLGDIGNPYHDNLRLFFQQISSKYEKIFYIPGNHEYYNYHVIPERCKTEFDVKLDEICREFNNIILMNNKTYYIDNIKIIGSTLWTNVPKENAAYITNAIRDYSAIKLKKNVDGELESISTEDTNRWNKEAVDYIENEISNTTDPCIVLTHHAPLFSNVDLNHHTADPIYLNGKNNYAFHNNLTSLISKPVVAWLYGHTHYASSFLFNGVEIATNQLGYSYEESTIKFNPYAYINLWDIMVDNL